MYELQLLEQEIGFLFFVQMSEFQEGIPGGKAHGNVAVPPS